MNIRDALIQRLTKRIARMREAFDRFDDATAEREMVGERWNVRDLAGHMAHWSGEAAERIPLLAAGAPSKDYDLDRVNDEVYRRNRRMSYVMLLPQLRAAEDRLLAAIRSVPAGSLMDSEARRWVDTIIEHYGHHWEPLKAAVDRLSSS